MLDIRYQISDRAIFFLDSKVFPIFRPAIEMEVVILFLAAAQPPPKKDMNGQPGRAAAEALVRIAPKI